MIGGSVDKSLDEIIGHGSPDIAQVAHPRIPYKKGPIVSGLELEYKHWDLDSVQLVLENFEQGGNSAHKCLVRFGTVRRCIVQ
jgi:hypothetical protein